MYVGVTKLLWHRLSINPQKLQVLKQSERSFPFAPKSSDGTINSNNGSNSSSSGSGNGDNNDSRSGDKNESPLLRLDRAVKDIQQQIEMIFRHEQQPSSSSSSSSSSASPSLPLKPSQSTPQPSPPPPQQQQQTNKNKDNDKGFDQDKRSEDILAILKSLRRLTNLCRDLLPGIV